MVGLSEGFAAYPTDNLPSVLHTRPVESVRDGDVWVVGDVHGEFEKLEALLLSRGFVDRDSHWAGGSATLWFIGDLTDRGPQGVEVIDLVMRLQQEAPASRGSVGCLMGNHDAFIIAARRFLDVPMHGNGISFLELWRMNGGQVHDLERLTADHLAWLSHLPFAASVEDHLLIHADSDFYLELGDSPDEINRNGSAFVATDDIEMWTALVRSFVRRNELWDDKPEGEAALSGLLSKLGARVVVHGHTPIPLIEVREAASVSEPLSYSSGRCLNVDGGMFLGGPGIAYRLSEGGRNIGS